MRYDISQSELQEAVEFYLNEKVLKRPVKIDSVEPKTYPSAKSRINYVLHVYAHDDQQHMPDEPKEPLMPPTVGGSV